MDSTLRGSSAQLHRAGRQQRAQLGDKGFSRRDLVVGPEVALALPNVSITRRSNYKNRSQAQGLSLVILPVRVMSSKMRPKAIAPIVPTTPIAAGGGA